MRTPRERTLDASVALLREGYAFAPNRIRRLGSDVVQTRLLGQPVLVMHGPDAARVFYDPERFQRQGALPARVRKTLTGDGAVQGLDGAAHRLRKHTFMQLMSPASIDELVRLFEQAWRQAVLRWRQQREVIVLDETRRLLCRAVCEWAGVPLPDADVPARARDLAAMVDGFGAAGPRHWRGRRARRRAEAWIEAVVDAVRGGRVNPGPDTALSLFAFCRDDRGHLLDRRTAAVEVLNVVRPVVAIATYVAFEAVALHEHRRWRDRIRSDPSGQDAELFAQEVRRFYPLTPFVAARVRSDFQWRGHQFGKGRLVLLDVYGALRDERLWPAADEFDPDRFRVRPDAVFSFIPQGGGDPHQGHRCAGERLTVAVMTAAAGLLTRHVEYEVPAQDLRADLGRIPTGPKSGFVIAGVREARPERLAESPGRPQPV